MAISFGRRGSGGGSGGSSRVGFVAGKQTSDLDISTHSGTFKPTTESANQQAVTSPWQLTNKSSGRAEITYGCKVELQYGGSGYSNEVRYRAKLQVRSSTAQNSGYGSWADLTILGSDGVVYDEENDYTSQTEFNHSIIGTLPFDLSELTQTGVDNNKWLQFRLQVSATFGGSPTSVDVADAYIALKSFGVGAGSTDIDGGEIRDGTITANELANNSVTRPKINADAVDGTKITDNAIGNEHIASNAVRADQIQALAVERAKIANDAIDGSKIADNAIGSEHIASDAVGASELADNTITPAKVAGVSASGNTDKVVAIDSGGGFKLVDQSSGGGGGITSVDPSDLDGITSSDTNEFIKTNSTGTEFVGQSHITASDLGLTGGGSDAGDFVTLDSAGTGFNHKGTLTPTDIGLSGTIAGRLVSINGVGDGFTTTQAQQGGAAPTLDNITGGPLALAKGGTGYAASDLDGLRQRLGIGSGAITDPELVRSTDADTQKDNTIHRFDSSTSNRPTGASNGIIARVGNDQWMLDVDDGQQWKREISNTGTGLWSTPVAATLTNLTTESDFRTLAEGGRGWTSSDNWLPSFSDGSKPAKVIVGRNGNYLVCIDRNNFFWAPRPTGGTWAEIPWRWEGTSTIPAGLYYTGGETDERLIPAGEDAVIGGKTNIPNENFVSLLVDHSVSGSTSTFTGYFVDDDNSQTLRSTTNTVGNTTGSWVRILVGSDGLAADSVNAAAIADEAVGADAIDNDIIVEDAGSSKAVFLGIVPSIDDLTFTGYTFKTSLTGFPEGGAYYDSSSRTMYVRHQPADTHLQGLFAIDYEVSIEKDASNYIRGVFDTISNFNLPGVGQLTGGVFRAADLDVAGTIANDDSVEIKGHKAVITKTDPIGTVNLADDAVTNAKIADDAVQGAQIADNAITPDKVSGVTASGNANQFVKINSSGNGFTVGSGGGGGGGASSIGELNSVYTQSASEYTVAATNVAAASLTAGQAHYVQASGTGNISIHFTSDDSGVNANLTNGSVITFWVANNKYRQLRITGNTAAGSSRIIVGTIVGGAGTIAVGDTLRILYNSTTAYDGVVKVGPDGKFTTGAVSVPSLGIAGAAADVGDILTIGTNGTFDATGGYILPSSVKPAISKSRSYTVVTGSVSDGQYAHNSGVPTFGTTDGGADATFLTTLDTSARAGDGTTILIVKDASNYISFRSTSAITQGSGLSIFSSTSNYSTVGTISTGDTVRVWLEPANANQIIQFDAIGENASLVELPSGGGSSAGAIKHTLMCKQEVTGSNEISNISTALRSPLQTQTGTWTVANKATDWIRLSGGGLCYFGNIGAQPICADIEVWYRWKNGSETYQTWSLSNSRVEAFDLGSDRLMVVKLFAGGSIGSGSINVTGNPVTAVTYTDNTRNLSHVDCAMGSGYKFGKLSQLNSAVVDGTDIQFTLAFTTQNPSPNYTARRWFLTAEILDGSAVAANF